MVTKHLEPAIALHNNTPKHLPTIEILDAAQRLDNPKTLKHTIRTDISSSEFNS